jgi:8-oxo-dGTP pyrophosphatase MutT (NUDIX family)
MTIEQVADYLDETFFVGIKAVTRNPQGEILLLETNSQFGPHWDLPGGKIHKNKTPEETLERELAEEVGAKRVTNINFLTADFSQLNHLSSKKLLFIIYTCDIAVDKVVLSTEHLRFGWYPPEEAAKFLEFRFGKRVANQIRNLPK